MLLFPLKLLQSIFPYFDKRENIFAKCKHQLHNTKNKEIEVCVFLNVAVFLIC